MDVRILKAIAVLASSLLVACDLANIDYGGLGCGTTSQQIDSVVFTRENFPYNPDYEDHAGMIDVGLKLVGANFCPKEKIKAGFYINILTDPAPVYISTLILSGKDTLQVPVAWHSKNNLNIYTGSIDSLFPKKNDGDNFAVSIRLTFRDKGDYFANTEYIKRLLVRAGITATYQKKEE